MNGHVMNVLYCISNSISVTLLVSVLMIYLMLIRNVKHHYTDVFYGVMVVTLEIQFNYYYLMELIYIRRMRLVIVNLMNHTPYMCTQRKGLHEYVYTYMFFLGQWNET